jgi:CheY-like chemotaxis protein
MTPAEIAEARKLLQDFRAHLAGLTRKPTVLLVEDSDSDARLVLHDISAFNVRAGLARTAPEAIHALEAQRYDLVLLDLRLGEGSGMEVLKYATDKNIDTLFIVLTGMDEHSPVIKEALDSGARFVIQKPVTNEHLNLIFGTL